MSDGKGAPRRGGDEVPDKPTATSSSAPYLSAWMAHWTSNTGCSPANGTRDKMPIRDESKEENGTNPMEAGGSRRAGGFREVNKAKTIEFMSETTGSGEFRSEKFGTWNRGSGNEGDSVRGGVGGREESLPSMLALAPSQMEAQSRESQFQLGSMPLNKGQQVLFDRFIEKGNLAGSVPLRAVLGSSSKITPYGLNTRPPFQSFFGWQADMNPAITPFWVHEKGSNNNNALSIQHQLADNTQLRDFVGEGFRRMPSHSGVRSFPSQSSPLEESEFKKIYGGSCVVPRVPSSIHDVETMRIYTMIDTVEESSPGPPKYSQTTHHLFIAKKTGGEQMFRESTISTECKGNTVKEFLSLCPGSTFQGRQGLTIKPLDSSTESEEKENIDTARRSAVDLKNESSADTDTMDMEALRENNLSGVASPASVKDVKEEQKLPISESLTTSFREKSQGRSLTTDLPDINQELPAIPGVAAAADNNETSTSKTQSLDMEHLVSHAKNPTNLNCATDPEFDPCSRWVKRLRPSFSDSFAHGTKGTMLGEAPPHQKVNKLFSKILICSKSSEPNIDKSHQGEMMMMNRTASERNSKSLSGSSVRELEDIKLSHAWIRRWCRNTDAFPKKKQQATGVCKPRSSKEAIDDLKEKQFPSIAAMALMGKAMNGFRPCEPRKKGALFIWNTEDY